MNATTDLRAAITAHPWKAVALAMAAGAYVALGRPSTPRSSTGRAMFAAVGGLTLGVLREIARQRATGFALSWIDERLRSNGAPASTAS